MYVVCLQPPCTKGSADYMSLSCQHRCSAHCVTHPVISQAHSIGSRPYKYISDSAMPSSCTRRLWLLAIILYKATIDSPLPPPQQHQIMHGSSISSNNRGSSSASSSNGQGSGGGHGKGGKGRNGGAGGKGKGCFLPSGLAFPLSRNSTNTLIDYLCIRDGDGKGKGGGGADGKGKGVHPTSTSTSTSTSDGKGKGKGKVIDADIDMPPDLPATVSSDDEIFSDDGHTYKNTYIHNIHTYIHNTHTYIQT